MDLTEKDYEKLGESLAINIAGVAESIFTRCGAKSDFCLQSVSAGGFCVFGGTNRLVFSPCRGWRIDPWYCTEQFTKLFNEIHNDFLPFPLMSL